MQQININNDLLVTQCLPNGYTWTLASRLEDMIYMAEELFGPRDQSYTMLGIEFVADGPRIWYPGDRKHIIIQLGPSAATDSVTSMLSNGSRNDPLTRAIRWTERQQP